MPLGVANTLINVFFAIFKNTWTPIFGTVSTGVQKGQTGFKENLYVTDDVKHHCGRQLLAMSILTSRGRQFSHTGIFRRK